MKSAEDTGDQAIAEVVEGAAAETPEDAAAAEDADTEVPEPAAFDDVAPDAVEAPAEDTPGEPVDAAPEAVEPLFQEAETVEPDYHEPEHHDMDLEEHGIFPTWLKVMLILLFGAAIALWGGPRLAPMLPSGLEPVARFLTPGGVNQAQEIDARLSALEQQRPTAAGVPTQAIDDAVTAALAEYDARIRSELSGLSDSVTAVESEDIKTRLAQLETAVQGLEAQMTSLGDQLSSTIADSVERQAAMNAEQAATYQAMIDRLNAELDQLSARQGTLQQAIDEVAAANTRIKQEAEIEVTTSQADKAATDIVAALETGAAFRPALDVLAGAVDGDLSTLQALADNGAPSLLQLRADFPPLAYAALRASMQADADGYTERALAFVKAQVATRSLTPQSGDSTDAVLSRIEAALEAGNLANCLSEAEALSDAARAPLSGWLASARQLSDATAELATATAQIARQKS